MDTDAFAAASYEMINQLLANMGMEAQISSRLSSSSGTTQGGIVQRNAVLAADETSLVTFVVITRWAWAVACAKCCWLGLLHAHCCKW
jgi:hypothetical protein